MRFRSGMSVVVGTARERFTGRRNPYQHPAPSVSRSRGVHVGPGLSSRWIPSRRVSWATELVVPRPGRFQCRHHPSRCQGCHTGVTPLSPVTTVCHGHVSPSTCGHQRCDEGGLFVTRDCHPCHSRNYLAGGLRVLGHGRRPGVTERGTSFRHFQARARHHGSEPPCFPYGHASGLSPVPIRSCAVRKSVWAVGAAGASAISVGVGSRRSWCRDGSRLDRVADGFRP